MKLQLSVLLSAILLATQVQSMENPGRKTEKGESSWTNQLKTHESSYQELISFMGAVDEEEADEAVLDMAQEAKTNLAHRIQGTLDALNRVNGTNVDMLIAQCYELKNSVSSLTFDEAKALKESTPTKGSFSAQKIEKEANQVAADERMAHKLSGDKSEPTGLAISVAENGALAKQYIDIKASLKPVKEQSSKEEKKEKKAKEMKKTDKKKKEKKN